MAKDVELTTDTDIFLKFWVLRRPYAELTPMDIDSSQLFLKLFNVDASFNVLACPADADLTSSLCDSDLN